MVINFKTYKINWDLYKLVWILILIEKKKKEKKKEQYSCWARANTVRYEGIVI